MAHEKSPWLMRFYRSKKYQVELYIADKQCNPFNAEKATKHVVIPNLDIEEICKFAEANKDKLDFVMVGSEKPIIEGIRDLIEKRTGIPVICPKQRIRHRRKQSCSTSAF